MSENKQKKHTGLTDEDASMEHDFMDRVEGEAEAKGKELEEQATSTMDKAKQMAEEAGKSGSGLADKAKNKAEQAKDKLGLGK